MSLTPVQQKALEAGLLALVHSPARGARRRLSGEVDNVRCFNSRTLDALVAKGLLVPERGGFSTTAAGAAALRAGS